MQREGRGYRDCLVGCLGLRGDDPVTSICYMVSGRVLKMASEAIFRARTYNRNLFSPVMMMIRPT